MVPHLLHVKTRGESTVPFCLVTIQHWIDIVDISHRYRAAQARNTKVPLDSGSKIRYDMVPACLQLHQHNMNCQA
jgi:hypothetical protein